MKRKKCLAVVLIMFLIASTLQVNAQEINNDNQVIGEESDNENDQNDKENVVSDEESEYANGPQEGQFENESGENQENDGSGNINQECKDNVQQSLSETKDADKSQNVNPFETMTEKNISDGWYSIHSFAENELCLDVVSGSENSGAAIQLFKFGNNLAQYFYVFKNDDGWYSIQNISSNKLLGISKDNPDSGSPILQWAENDEAIFQFKFYENEEGAIIIRINSEDNLVLDSHDIRSGIKIQTEEYTEADSQMFILKSQKSAGIEENVEEGIYRIYPSYSSNVSLDLWDASTKNGANIWLYNNNGSAAQEWKISKQGSWYKITSTVSELSLDVKNGSAALSTNLQQWKYNGGRGQLYRFYKNEEGQYCILSKLGTAIDCKAGVLASKTNVQMYKINGSKAQMWGLEKIMIPAKSEIKPQEGYYTISTSIDSSLCVSVESESNEGEANIQLNEKTDKDSQIFGLELQSDGWYMIRNLKSGKYLDVKGGKNTPGTNLQQQTKNGSNAQKFKFFDAGNGKYYIKSKLLTVIEAETAEDGNVYMDAAECTDQQKWALTRVFSEKNIVNIANGDYIISTGLGNNQVLDIKSGSKSSGANVQIYTSNKSMAQNFYIHKESDGWYTIQNNKSKLYLDVWGGESTPGTNLQQYKQNKSDAQKFKFYETGNGRFYIRSKLGTFIDVKSGKNSPGTNVQMYSFNGSNAQQWKLTKSKRIPMNEWVYKDGYKLYYNSSGKLVKDVSNLIGKQSSYVIKVNKKKNVVTVYAKDGNKGYIIPVKSFICSTGAATPIGTFYTPAKYRWRTLMGPCYGQWCTRINGGVLFHSVFYSTMNNTTLSVSAYNKLGTTCSHGCVRLTAGDAKWIYDNCKLKTKVIIYNSDDVGPFGKPSAYKLPSWHKWDPTDPNVKKKCAQKGCH